MLRPDMRYEHSVVLPWIPGSKDPRKAWLYQSATGRFSSELVCGDQQTNVYVPICNPGSQGYISAYFHAYYFDSKDDMLMFVLRFGNTATASE